MDTTTRSNRVSNRHVVTFPVVGLSIFLPVAFGSGIHLTPSFRGRENLRTRRNRVAIGENRHVVTFLLVGCLSIFLPVAFGSGIHQTRSFRGREILQVVPLVTPPAQQPPSPPPTPNGGGGSIGGEPPAIAPSSKDPQPPPSPLAVPSLTPPATPPPSSVMAPSVPESPPPPPPSPPATPDIVPASPPGDTWNESELAGVVIASIAALLQVAVVAFLLIKRHQMLTTVEYDDIDDLEYDHPREQNF